MTFDAIASSVNRYNVPTREIYAFPTTLSILRKYAQQGSMHKDTTYQGSDRQDFYRHGKKEKKKKKKKTNILNADLDWVCHRQPSNKLQFFCREFLPLGLIVFVATNN